MSVGFFILGCALMYPGLGLQVASTITLTVTPTSLSVGEQAVCHVSGTATPNLTGILIELKVRDVGLTEWSVLNSTYIGTDSAGHGEATFVQTSTRTGAFEVMATASHESNVLNSNIVTVNAVSPTPSPPPPPVPYINVYSATSFAAGFVSLLGYFFTKKKA